MQKYGYAQLANIHTLTKHKVIARRRFGTGGLGERPHIHNGIAIDCENLYRVISLIAYGNGWASLRDIDHFAQITSDNIRKVLKVPVGTVKIKALLPHDESLSGETSTSHISVPYNFEEKYQPILATRELIKNREYQLFTLSANRVGDKTEILGLVRLLGELIANYFAPQNYIGTFNGKPEFKDPQSTESLLQSIESPWLSLSQLKHSNSPRLCPVCGKVVERSVGKAGGKPPIACSKSHIDKYNNEKKRLLKTSDPNMQFDDKREAKAREMRWNDKNNERPYKFSGVADMEEYLKEAEEAESLEKHLSSICHFDSDE